MFTGIISDLGRVRDIRKAGDTRIEFETGYAAQDIAIGASIACSGVCLTVIAKDTGWFAAEVSAETLSATTMGSWRPGTPVNFERPLAAGDEMGGHIVLGHVDGVAEITAIAGDGDSLRFTFRAPPELMKFIAAKGSVALDGISLTVNEVGDTSFGVNIIPHTAKTTNLGSAKAGGRVNLEIDPLARYVARFLEKD